MTAITRVLFACLLGFLHWLFGNLYETIVFTPNTLLTNNPVAVLTTIRDLFKISAPYYYYLPWSPLSIFCTICVWFMLRRTNLVEAQRWITFAVVSAISAGLVTWYIIANFNLTLWVGSTQYTTTGLTELLWQNTAVGLFRLGLVGVTIYFLYRTARLVIIAQIKATPSD